ncbi:MAG TPA: hypothetical protein VIL68_02510 [Propionibacteriaceae bacterium]
MSPRQNAAACGTDSGYAKHLRLGETTCPPCRKAHRVVANTAALAAKRAMWAIRYAYPEAYRAAYAHELAKLRWPR